jgi:hypothetical protein
MNEADFLCPAAEVYCMCCVGYCNGTGEIGRPFPIIGKTLLKGEVYEHGICKRIKRVQLRIKIEGIQ